MRTTARFAAGKEQFKNLHDPLQSVEFCDCAHMIEISFSIPETLVVTKTRKELERRKQERKANLIMLSRLTDYMKQTPQSLQQSDPASKNTKFEAN